MPLGGAAQRSKPGAAELPGGPHQQTQAREAGPRLGPWGSAVSVQWGRSVRWGKMNRFLGMMVGKVTQPGECSSVELCAWKWLDGKLQIIYVLPHF